MASRTTVCPGLLLSLFAQASGGALDKNSSDECESVGFWQDVLQNVLVGFVSIMLSTLPMLIVRVLHKRAVVFKEQWEEADRKKQLRNWQQKDMAAHAIAFIYIGFSLLFVMAFLANIAPSSEKKWLTTVVTALVKELVIGPLGLAVVYATLVTLVAQSPKFVQRNRNHVLSRSAHTHSDTMLDSAPPYTFVAGSGKDAPPLAHAMTTASIARDARVFASLSPICFVALFGLDCRIWISESSSGVDYLRRF